MAYIPPNPNGQATKANSSPVTIASDQNNSLETGGNLATLVSHQTDGTQQSKITDGTNVVNVLKSDGTAAGQNSQLTARAHLAVSFTTTTVQAVGSTDVANYSFASVHIVAQGGSSTVNFQGSNDNSNWVAISVMSTAAVGASIPTTSTTSAGAIFACPLNFRYFRLNVTGIVSGTTSGVIEFFSSPYATYSTSLTLATGASAIGSLTAVVPGVAATSLGKAEDAAHASGDTGVMALSVRSDTPASTAGTTGDYQPPITDSIGQTWVTSYTTATSLGKAEDAAHASGDTGVAVFAVRRDTAASSSGTDGDYSTINTNSIGDVRIFESSVEVSSNFSAILNDVDIAVKASAGYLKSIIVTNINAAIRYVQVHNKATAPANPDVPIWSIPIAAGTATAPAILILGLDVFGQGGLSCATGVAVGVSTTAATFTAATTTDHTIHGTYV